MTEKHKPGDADDQPEDPYEAAWQLLQEIHARDAARGFNPLDDLPPYEEWQAWAESERRKDAQGNNRPRQAPHQALQTFGSYEAWKNRHRTPAELYRTAQVIARNRETARKQREPELVELVVLPEQTLKQGLLEAAKNLLMVILLPFVGGGMILLWLLGITVAGLIFWGVIYVLALVAGIPIASPE